MTPQEESISALLAALEVSPDNVPLRKHIADQLMDLEAYNQAEQQFTKALEYAPNDIEIKLGLAEAFFGQDKYSASLVILEELMEHDPPLAEAFFVHAEISLATDEVSQALESYQEAVRLDRSLRDTAFETQLAEAGATPEDPMGGRVPVGYQNNEEEEAVEVERPSISFKEVGGMDNLKEEINLKLILPMQQPELYRAYGKSIGGGMLLYGPPGVGKTHLARATAGEVKAGFIAVGIHDILDMWMGNSEKNLHEVFQAARANAPCVLFFDEVDALGASRSDMKQSGGRHLINQFLSELDGVKYSNDGVLILAATNTPWHMDSAFRRPGRFDRILFVPPPDAAARAAIMKILLKGKPTGNLNLEKLLRKAEGFSGADLKSVVDLAVESKLRASLQAGKPLPIEQGDLQQALKQVKASTKEWFTTARNYAMYSNEAGLYDDILAYLNIKK
ncbi:MAG: AAA family ATPase [Bacteroidota bacterium]